jgi:hypothetical protein
MRRQIIVGALFIAVLIILVRTIIGSTFVKRVMESFQSGSGSAAAAAINTMTVCPVGSNMYIYEGRTYCCNGTINTDADDVQRTCRAPIYPPGFQTTFCTLGPAHKGVKNCLALRGGLMQTEGEIRCPPSKPNFCQSDAGATGRCCTGPANEALTDCNVATDVYCDMVPAGSNPIQTQWKGSCDFQRLAEVDAQSCPKGYHQTITDGQSTFAGVTIYGCTNMTQTCYSADMIGRLNKMGLDTSTLQSCATIAAAT